MASAPLDFSFGNQSKSRNTLNIPFNESKPVLDSEYFSVDSSNQSTVYRISISGTIKLSKEKSFNDDQKLDGIQNFDINTNGKCWEYIVTLSGGLTFKKILESDSHDCKDANNVSQLKTTADQATNTDDSFQLIFDPEEEEILEPESQNDDFIGTNKGVFSESKPNLFNKTDISCPKTFNEIQQTLSDSSVEVKQELNEDSLTIKEETPEDNVRVLAPPFSLVTKKKRGRPRILNDNGIQKSKHIKTNAVKVIIKKSLLAAANRKFKEKSASKILKCSECGFSCFQTRALNKHLQSHLEGNKIRIKKENSGKLHTGFSFCCCICNFPTKTPFSMMKHLSKNHKNQNIYSCGVCDHDNRTSSDLCEHIEEFHKRFDSFVCNTCLESFDKWEDLVKHNYDSHATGKYVCEICYKSSKTRTAMREHAVEYHTVIPNPLQYSCGECGEYTSSVFKGLQIHAQCRHSEERPYLCSVCGQSFKTKANLRHHAELHGEKIHYCSLCSFSSKQSVALSNHMRRTHTTDKTYLCELCPYVGKTQHHLTQHKAQAHSTKRPFPCTMCNYSAKTASVLKTHYRNIHSASRPFVCNLCPYSSKTKDNLECHKIRKHSIDKPLLCTLCDYRCKIERELKIHYERKHDPNCTKHVFKCLHCEYVTNTNWNLKEHLQRKHMEGRPWSCGLCRFTVKTKVGLHAHYRRKHKLKPPFPPNFELPITLPLDMPISLTHKLEPFHDDTHLMPL